MNETETRQVWMIRAGEVYEATEVVEHIVSRTRTVVAADGRRWDEYDVFDSPEAARAELRNRLIESIESTRRNIAVHRQMIAGFEKDCAEFEAQLSRWAI
ncbi:MAG: hypothetical protein Q7K03_10645 [Dehalococcoidia bacterium]|nr:hypothetical protein [Dehalococcoidia bacterium]